MDGLSPVSSMDGLAPVSSMDGLSPVSYQNALDPTTTNDNGCQVCSDDFKSNEAPWQHCTAELFSNN